MHAEAIHIGDIAAHAAATGQTPDDIRNIIAMEVDRALRGGWEPISEAPLDGRKLLCWHPGLGLDWLVLSFYDGMWREPANGLGLKTPPTHYMPMPAKPNT